MPEVFPLLALLQGDPTGARWLDLLGLAILVLFFALGARRGLWWQAVRLLGIVAAYAVTRAIAPELAPVIGSALPGLDPRAASGIAWVALLLLCLIAVALVGRLGRTAIEAAQLRALDRIGGALAGGLSGIVVHVAVLVCIVHLSSRAFVDSSVRGTHSQRMLEALGERWPLLLDAQAAETLAPLRRVTAPGESAPPRVH